LGIFFFFFFEKVFFSLSDRLPGGAYGRIFRRNGLSYQMERDCLTIVRIYNDCDILYHTRTYIHTLPADLFRINKIESLPIRN